MVDGSVSYIFDDKQVLALLQAVELALSPMSLLTWMDEAVAPFFDERITSRFDTEGDEAVGRWVPLAAATQAIRASEGYGAAHPINVRTGELRDFVRTHGTRAEGDAGVVLQYPERLPQGELAEKMDLAQNGGTSGATGGAVPARPVLGMGTADLTAVIGLLEKHVTVGGSIL